MMKEEIIKIIESDPVTKHIYENNCVECFNNVILPNIESLNDNEDVFNHLVFMVVTLSAIYDKLLDNIAKCNDTDLIIKCNNDINAIYLSEVDMDYADSVPDITESVSEETETPLEE